METFTGIVIVKKIICKGKPVTQKAYLVTHDFKTFELCSAGNSEIDDNCFYELERKEVLIKGEIQNEKWIVVDAIIRCTGLFQTFEKEKSISFKKLTDYFTDLVNCEGAILSVVAATEEINDDTKDILYIKGKIKNEAYIYAQTNSFALTMFFQGRISIKELFLLRDDELYVIETFESRNKKQKFIHYSEGFVCKYIDNIELGNLNFFSIPVDMRIQNPFEEVIKKIEIFI